MGTHIRTLIHTLGWTHTHTDTPVSAIVFSFLEDLYYLSYFFSFNFGFFGLFTPSSS